MDTLTCKSCSGAVIPRLWTHDTGLFRHLTTQHQCPLCGHIMFETGGSINGWGKFWGLAIVLIAITQLSESMGSFGKTIVQIAIGSVVILWLFTKLKKFFKDFSDGYHGRR